MKCKSVIFSLFNAVQLETQTLWQYKNKSGTPVFLSFFFLNASLELRKKILMEIGEVKTARKG